MKQASAEKNDKLWYCYECQKDLDTVHVDGRNLSSPESLLEDVKFVVKKGAGGKPECIGVLDKDKEYFEQFNAPYFIKACTDICSDGHNDDATCPFCGEPVMVVPYVPRPVTVRRVKVRTFREIMDEAVKNMPDGR